MNFRDQDIEETCKKLKPLIGDRADNLWYMYMAEDYKGKQDIALDIELLAEKLLKKTALTDKPVLLNPPAPDDSHGAFYLGDIEYNSKKVHSLFLRHEDFIKQIGIFAITGEGKTNLAYLLALQLLKKGIPFIVIDWKRSWRNLLSLKDTVPELKKVQLYTIGRDASPFFWNPFRAPPGSNRALWIGTISEALEKSHMSGPGVAYFFNIIYLKLFRLLKNTSNDFYPNFFDGLREIENIRAYERELKWKQTALRIFQSFTVGSASKVFNSRHPVKIEDLLDKPVILELDLEMPKLLRIFFSEIILRWIHLYRLSQGETEKLRHVLFLEEAHNLFADTGFYRTIHAESNNLENIYREIRAFGQGIISITQHPALLPIYLLGNCHTQIFLGLQHADDIRAARKSLFLNEEEEEYLNMLKVGECIVKIKNRISPCLIKTPLVPVKKGFITDDWLRVNTHGNLPTRQDENRPTLPGYLPHYKYKESKTGKNPSQITSSHHRLLADIYLNPFSGITNRYKRLTLNPKYGNAAKNLLISQGIIQPQKIITAKGWITLFNVTQKGNMTLKDIGHNVPDSREGIVHKFWKNQIAQYYKDKGLNVLVEKEINGRADIIVENHNNKKAAIEIETGKSYALQNIRRDLEAGFDEIFSVATSKDVEERIRKELERNRIADERVRVTNVLGFCAE